LLDHSSFSALTHFPRGARLAQELNYRLSHFLVVAGRNEVTGFAVDDRFARAAHIGGNYRTRSSHVFQN
jgi:hypothetical protein